MAQSLRGMVTKKKMMAPRGRALHKRQAMPESESESDEDDDNDECEEEEEAAGGEYGADSFDAISADLEERGIQARQLYQAPPTTKEYEERHYWDVSSCSEKQRMVASLVIENRFWSDYATYAKSLLTQGKDPLADPSTLPAFLSRNLTAPITSFADVLCRLAVIGLPFTSRLQSPTIEGARSARMSVKANTPCIVFHQEMREIKKEEEAEEEKEEKKGAEKKSSVSVNVAYLDPFDMYERQHDDDEDEEDNDERRDKYVEEFIPRKIYVARVVLTNVSSGAQRVEALIQIPEGSIPVGSFGRRGQETRTKFIEIPAYASTVINYLFYFPSAGVYKHYPVQAIKKGSKSTRVVGVGPRSRLVVDRPKHIKRDLRDWSVLSQSGSEDEVRNFLRTANLHRNVDLALMLWRFEAIQGRKPPACSSGDPQAFFHSVIDILRSRLIFDHRVWCFALKHGDDRTLAELLQRSPFIMNSVGQYFQSMLVQKDAADYAWNEIQHLEYKPLFNSRAHTLRTAAAAAAAARRGEGNGDKRALTIQNKEFSQQYQRFMSYISDRYSGAEHLGDHIKLALSYYMLLQERIDEARGWFQMVRPPAGSVSAKTKVVPSGASAQATTSKSSSSLDSGSCALQYDYLSCFFSFFSANPSDALSIARAYSSTEPLIHKRKLFIEVENQIQEMLSVFDVEELMDEQSKSEAGSAATAKEAVVVRDEQDRARTMSNLASSEPVLDVQVVGKSLHIHHANVEEIRMNLYRMGIETQFSSAPFIMCDNDAGAPHHSGGNGGLSSFLFLKPNETLTVRPSKSKLAPAGLTTHVGGEALEVALPPAFANTNCWIEVTDGTSSGNGNGNGAGSGGLSVTRAYFAHDLLVQLQANYGQVKVVSRSTGKPLPGAYVKVYGRSKSDSTHFFYKDGYTDHRGKFDYASLSTDKLSSVNKFAILILHEKYGAVVKAADPPQQ